MIEEKKDTKSEQDSKLDMLISKVTEVLEENKQLKLQVEQLRIEAQTKRIPPRSRPVLHSIRAEVARKNTDMKEELLSSPVFERAVDALILYGKTYL